MQYRTRSDNPDLPLRQSHPQLYKAMLLKTAMLIAVALAILIRPEFIIEENLRRPDPVIPLQFWAILYLGIAATLAYGVTNGLKRYKWARRALVAGAIITGIWAVGYMFAVFGGTSDKVFAAIFWVYACTNFIIWAGEPAFNPLSSALGNNSKAGELKDYQ